MLTIAKLHGQDTDGLSFSRKELSANKEPAMLEKRAKIITSTEKYMQANLSKYKVRAKKFQNEFLASVAENKKSKAAPIAENELPPGLSIN